MRKLYLEVVFQCLCVCAYVYEQYSTAFAPVSLSCFGNSIKILSVLLHGINMDSHVYKWAQHHMPIFIYILYVYIKLKFFLAILYSSSFPINEILKPYFFVSTETRLSIS